MLMGVLQAVVVAHLASMFVLVGLIWTVQVVHYPLMALVGREHFVAYEAAHSPRMASVVVLPWAVQGITTAWLLVERPEEVGAALVWGGAVAALVTVLVTALASVPAHTLLSAGFDAQTHARLVRTNWLRTAAWSAHACIATAIAVRTFVG